MERTESTVIQVAPSYENQKIEEMQAFGWGLQGRQEIHEKGDAYGRPSYLSDNTYIVKTTVHNYVKLHFIRPFNFPNRDQIRAIESEYSNLPFPTAPSLKAPGCFTAFWCLGIPASFMVMSEHVAQGLAALAAYAAFIALGIVWINSRRRKARVAQETCLASLNRAQELRRQVDGLLAAAS